MRPPMLDGPIVRQRNPARVAESRGVESWALIGDLTARSAAATSASGVDLRMRVVGMEVGRHTPRSGERALPASILMLATPALPASILMLAHLVEGVGAARRQYAATSGCVEETAASKPHRR